MSASRRAAVGAAFLPALAAVLLQAGCAAAPVPERGPAPPGPRSRRLALARAGDARPPHDLAFSPRTGDLFAADAAGGRVARFDAAGLPAGEFGRRGWGFVRFRALAGIDVGGEGDVLCVDAGRATVLSVDPEGRAVRYQREPAWAGAGTARIADVAAAGAAGFFLLACRDGRRFLVDPSGREIPLPESGTQTAAACGGALASDGQAGVYHVDGAGDRVDHLAAGAASVRSFRLRRLGAGPAPIASGVAVAAAGLVLASDGGQGVVQAFDPEGGFLGLLSEEGGRIVRLADPGAIAADGSGRIAVADRATGAIELRELTAGPGAGAQSNDLR